MQSTVHLSAADALKNVLQAPEQPPDAGAAQAGDGLPSLSLPPLGRISDSSQGGSHQGSGSPHCVVATSEGSSEAVRCSDGVHHEICMPHVAGPTSATFGRVDTTLTAIFCHGMANVAHCLSMQSCLRLSNICCS